MKQGLIKAITAVLVTLTLPFIVSRGVDISQNGLRYSRFDTGAGKAIFQEKCARCHSLQAGVNGVGPSLATVGQLAANRKPGMSSVEYLLESVLFPNAFKAPGSSGEMPSNLMTTASDDSVRNLVAFLLTQGSQVPEPELAEIRIERPAVADTKEVADREQLLRGEAIFRGKGGCISCHSPYARPEFELTAPHVFQSGGRDIEALRKAIVSPHEAVAKKYQSVTIALVSGEVISGTLLKQTDQQMILMTYADGKPLVRELEIADIDSEADGSLMISKNATSIMPNGFQTLLSTSELDDLIAFLRFVN